MLGTWNEPSDFFLCVITERTWEPATQPEEFGSSQQDSENLKGSQAPAELEKAAHGGAKTPACCFALGVDRGSRLERYIKQCQHRGWHMLGI